MTTDNAPTETKPFPAAFTTETQYADAYAETLISYLEAHSDVADDKEFSWWDSAVRSDDLDDALPNTPSEPITSPRQAELLYAYIRGMQTTLARLDDQVATTEFAEGGRSSD